MNSEEKYGRHGFDPDDILNLYMDEAGQYSLLSKDDEVRLAQTIEGAQDLEAKAVVNGVSLALGGYYVFNIPSLVEAADKAREEFMTANLRLVISTARRYQGRGLEMLDLISEGNFGLMHAIDKFDWRKGFKFSTYAMGWIMQSIQRGIGNQGRTIRLPIAYGEKVRGLTKHTTQLVATLGREPTTVELAEEMEISSEEILELQVNGLHTMHIDRPLEGSDGSATSTLMDMVSDRKVDVASEAISSVLKPLPEVVEGLLDKSGLSEAERKIIEYRWGLIDGLTHSLDDTAIYSGIPRRRVSQAEQKAMEKLRMYAEDNDVDPSLILAD